MKSYQIISDSSCDIPESLVQQYNIQLVPFYVSFDQQNYYKERIELQVKEFYQTLREQDVFPKTSLPSVQDYLEVFKATLDKGMDILCFCLTPKFSGSYQSAQNARNMLLEDYPDAKIEIVNSIQATAGQGLVVLESALMQNAGLPFDTVMEKIQILKESARIMFTVDTLEYLQKGGRIGKANALLGSILNVKPTIVVKDGELIPHGKVRGRKKALKEILEMTREDLGNTISSYRFCIANADCLEDAENVKQALKEELGVHVDLPFFDVGVTIGTHTGPSALGICYIRKFDTL